MSGPLPAPKYGTRFCGQYCLQRLPSHSASAVSPAPPPGPVFACLVRCRPIRWTPSRAVPAAVSRGAGRPTGRLTGRGSLVATPAISSGVVLARSAIRAEHHQHHADTKARTRAAARRAPAPGQKGSRRWRQHRRAQRLAEARHRRRVAQAQHEAAQMVVSWAVARRAGTLAGTGPPRPPPPEPGGSRSPHGEDPVNTRRTYGDVH